MTERCSGHVSGHVHSDHVNNKSLRSYLALQDQANATQRPDIRAVQLQCAYLPTCQARQQLRKSGQSGKPARSQATLSYQQTQCARLGKPTSALRRIKARPSVLNKGSRTSAPSVSTAGRAYMTASFAHCSRGSANTSQYITPNMSYRDHERQDLPLLEKVNCSVPRLPETSQVSMPYAKQGNKQSEQRWQGVFSKMQISFIFSLLVFLNRWIAMLDEAKSRHHNHWATFRLCTGIYRRRKYLQQATPQSEYSYACTPIKTFSKQSRTGPKSSSHYQLIKMHLFILLLLWTIQNAGAARVMAEARVVTDTSAVTGAVHRQITRMPTNGENTGEARRLIANGLSWTAKRSLRRARARAEREGGTHYKGRWCSAERLRQTRHGLSHFVSEEPASDRSQPTINRSRQEKRIRCITFNISGASSAAWQECMAWLQNHQQDIDVALVQETHWRGEGSRDFMSGPWFVVTTGATASDSKAGLAVLIHKRLGRPEQISAQTHLQGRFMHVRIHQGQNSIDILNVYQHVWRSQLDREGNTKCRESVWRKLRQVTTKIPQRNTLVVGGDFNCTIRRMKHHIGSAIVATKEPSPDQEEFLGYLQDHGMTLLNTWNAKPTYTCQTGDSQTQIDFILCRSQHADTQAKGSRPWYDSNIGRWKANHHVPVWASIRHIDPCRLPQKKTFKSYKATLQASIEMKDQQAMQLQHKVEQKIQDMTDTGEIEDISARIDDIMLSTIAEVYRPDQQEDNRISQDVAVQFSVKSMWQTYAKFRAAKAATVKNILEKWKLYKQFQKASKHFRHTTKEIKKERITQIADELARAEVRGDQRKLWECARKLAPWKPKSRTSLRGKAGEILAPQQQLQELIKHSETKFCKGEPYLSQHQLQNAFWIDPNLLEKISRSTPYEESSAQTHRTGGSVEILCQKCCHGRCCLSKQVLGRRHHGPNAAALEGYAPSVVGKTKQKLG